MSIFNLTDEKMKETSSTFTAHEIYQQPATWRKTCAQLAACKDELQAFIDQVVKQDDFDIVLTGAGTSEFVGNSLFQALNPKYDFKVKSYASTDLVPSPENFLSRTKPTLLVNFGRSGNSPESLGNVEAAEVVCQNLYHLFVTCNHEGTLSKLANTRHNCFAINLTPETHDQSFAMTSSYSNMYLATYLAFNLDKLDEITAEVVKEMAHQRKGNKIAVVYNHDCEGIEELADYPIQIKVGADMENVLLGLDFILFAQTIALMKSLSLGITPDNPCPTGEVNRVVKGVTLYPYTLK